MTQAKFVERDEADGPAERQESGHSPHDETPAMTDFTPPRRRVLTRAALALASASLAPWVHAASYRAWALKTYADEKRFVEQLQIKIDE
jgi:hypothetical protein